MVAVAGYVWDRYLRGPAVPRAMTALNVATLLLSALLGVYYLSQAGSLSAKPRRGTALRLPRRGYQAIGVLWLVIAALRLVTLLA